MRIRTVPGYSRGTAAAMRTLSVPGYSRSSAAEMRTRTVPGYSRGSAAEMRTRTVPDYSRVTLAEMRTRSVPGYSRGTAAAVRTRTDFSCLLTWHCCRESVPVLHELLSELVSTDVGGTDEHNRPLTVGARVIQGYLLVR